LKKGLGPLKSLFCFSGKEKKRRTQKREKKKRKLFSGKGPHCRNELGEGFIPGRTLGGRRGKRICKQITWEMKSRFPELESRAKKKRKKGLKLSGVPQKGEHCQKRRCPQEKGERSFTIREKKTGGRRKKRKVHVACQTALGAAYHHPSNHPGKSEKI